MFQLDDRHMEKLNICYECMCVHLRKLQKSTKRIKCINMYTTLYYVSWGGMREKITEGCLLLPFFHHFENRTFVRIALLKKMCHLHDTEVFCVRVCHHTHISVVVICVDLSILIITHQLFKDMLFGGFPGELKVQINFYKHL